MNGNVFNPKNVIELHCVVVCKAIEVQDNYVVADLGAGVRGTISCSEFDGPIAKTGDYFEAEIIGFDENDLPVLSWGEIIPSYDIKPYSFIRACVEEIKESYVYLRINKYKRAKMPRSEIDINVIDIGDMVEAEVIELDNDGYVLLGWGNIVDSPDTRPYCQLKHTDDSAASKDTVDFVNGMIIQKDNDKYIVGLNDGRIGIISKMDIEDIEVAIGDMIDAIVVSANKDGTAVLSWGTVTKNYVWGTVSTKDVTYILLELTNGQTCSISREDVNTDHIAIGDTIRAESDPFDERENSILHNGIVVSSNKTHVKADEIVRGIIIDVSIMNYILDLNNGEKGILPLSDIDKNYATIGDIVEAHVSDLSLVGNGVLLKLGKLINHRVSDIEAITYVNMETAKSNSQKLQARNYVRGIIIKNPIGLKRTR